MASLVRLGPAAGTKSLISPAMSSLAPGQLLAGVKWDYRLLQRLGKVSEHRSNVFKAEVLPRAGVGHIPRWAVVKAALPDNENSRLELEREYSAYRRPSIESSPCFRKMYDIVEEPFCLILEWMDSTLAMLEYEAAMHSYTIIQAVVEKALGGGAALHQDNLVDTDMKPDKILISGIESDHPIVKLGDLGLVFRDGSRFAAQPWAMRAPEVYLGQPCTHHSEVWAVAATLLCWAKPGVFGTPGNSWLELRESWCMAKIMRLFPSWTPPPVKDGVLQAEINLAKAFIKGEEPEIMKVSSLKDEMQTMDMLPELRGLLRRLFIVDPKTRPSAAEALASKEYLALAEKARSNLDKDRYDRLTARATT